MNWFESFVAYFTQYPFVIKVVWILIVILFINILIFAFLLKILRAHLRRREGYTHKYQQEIESYLIAYIAYENDKIKQENVYAKIKFGVTNSLKRRIMLSTMLKLKTEVSGEMTEIIQKLFLKLGLLSFSQRKLKNSKWHVVAIGIKQLKLFGITSEYDEVMKHVNHPKLEVRREAYLYLVSVFQFKGLDFLNRVQVPLSEWGQIQLLNILKVFDDNGSENIKKWLKSTNDSVVLFVLKLCRKYNLMETKEVLLELLSHQNKEVRIVVIKLLSDFQVVAAKNILKENYESISLEEQIIFFKMLEIQAVKEDVPFVIKYIQDINFQIKISALKILKLFDIEKLRSLKKGRGNLEYKTIVEFVEHN